MTNTVVQGLPRWSLVVPPLAFVVLLVSWGRDLGTVLLILGLGFAGSATVLLALIPLPAVGALLLVAGGDLAVSRRLFDAQPSCWPVIAVAAAATLLVNPAIGLLAGCAGELARKAILQAINTRSA